MTTDTREGMIFRIKTKCVEANPPQGWSDAFGQYDIKESADFVSSRKCRLADVLLAIRKKRSVNLFDFSEKFIELTDIGEGNVYSNMLYFLTENWNLLEDDIERQSDDTIGFLHGLLK